MSRFRLSEAEAQRLRELTAQGCEQQEIAEALGWRGTRMNRRNRVYRWQRALGISGSRPGIRAPELTAGQKRQALKLITKKRVGRQRVAKMLGVGEWAVRKVAKENGGVKAFISAELRARVEQDLKQRTDYLVNIAAKYRINYKFVRAWAHKLYGPARFLGGLVRPPLTSVEPQNHFPEEARK